MRERRLAAFYVDALLSGLFVNIIILVLGDEIGWYIGVPLNILYMLLKDALPQGSSIGKRLFKLQVQDHQGKPIAGNFSKSFIRNLPLIPPIWLVEALRLAFNQKRYGDIWSETQVVKL